MQELQDREETKRMKQEEKERERIECGEHKKVKEASKMKGTINDMTYPIHAIGCGWQVSLQNTVT